MNMIFFLNTFLMAILKLRRRIVYQGTYNFLVRNRSPVEASKTFPNFYFGMLYLNVKFDSASFSLQGRR